jgi:hypothetical protein
MMGDRTASGPIETPQALNKLKNNAFGPSLSVDRHKLIASFGLIRGMKGVASPPG